MHFRLAHVGIRAGRNAVHLSFRLVWAGRCGPEKGPNDANITTARTLKRLERLWPREPESLSRAVLVWQRTKHRQQMSYVLSGKTTTYNERFRESDSVFGTSLF